MIRIFNEDCMKTIGNMPVGAVDLIVTSPPYNTNMKAGKCGTLNTAVSNKGYTHVRYDGYVDTKTNEEYIDWCVKLFHEFARVVKLNGCVLWNVSYGAENTECMFRTVSAICEKTEWTIADTIVWKKKSALPNNVSPNRLTRICEYVFVFVRRGEEHTMFMNKKETSRRNNGQVMYENIYNFIEAANNDGECKLNKATYSTELVNWLLKLYAPQNGIVYDPFMGSGTTANACRNLSLDCYGSEISKAQCEYAKKRVSDMFAEVDVVHESN